MNGIFKFTHTACETELDPTVVRAEDYIKLSIEENILHIECTLCGQSEDIDLASEV